MNPFEINQIKQCLRRLDFSEEFVDRYVHEFQINCESYTMTCKMIDRWKKEDSSEIVAKVLVCGLIATVLGGF